MPALAEVLIMAALAGAAIPFGAWLAGFERLLPGPLRDEARHWIIAFGAGALLSAVALVLVPEGIDRLHSGGALAAFVAGGLAALTAERLLARFGGSWSQLVAMLLDFIPEAIALGALAGADRGQAAFLAAVIAGQNIPEAFNAERELADIPRAPARLGRLALFVALVPLGPAAAYAGMAWFSEADTLLGALMLFAAGGILYLMFQDIAPKVPQSYHWGPPLGTILGFALGLLGHILTS